MAVPRAATLRTTFVLFALMLIWGPIQSSAESDDDFELTAVNRAATCKTLWNLPGLPRYAKGTKRDATIVCKKRYLVSHNNAAKTPDWVLEQLTKNQVTGPNKRPSQSFVQEKRVPPHGRATNEDYTKKDSPFARGHMAPSEDFNRDAALMKESFVYSNAVPQIGAKFNSAIWGSFEDEVRKATIERGTLFVITGPIRRQGDDRTATIAKADNACGNEIAIEGPEQAQICAANNKNGSTPCTSGVSVPIAVYKVIYDAKEDVAYAFVLPNRDHPSKTGNEVRPYLETFQTTVAVVEKLTGIEFFRDMSAERQDKLVKQCAADKPWAEDD